MLQNDATLENSGQKSCFLRAEVIQFHEKVGSGTLLVPKSRFYRFWMTAGIQNDCMLAPLSSSNPLLATLGARFGDPLDPNLEIFIKSAPQMLPKS